MKNRRSPPTPAAAPPAKPQRGIQSVEVGGRLLRALAAARAPLAPSDLAASGELAPGQAHAYLVSLARLGLVKRDALSGRYEPGPLALRLALLRVEQQPALRAAVPRAAALAQRLGCSVALCIAGPQGPTIVRYEHASLPLHVNLHVGTVMSLPATSTGRVFCAFAAPDALRAMWDNQAAQPAYSGEQDVSASHADDAAFAAALDTIRARGLERSVDAPSPGVSSVCVPVLDDERGLAMTLTAIGATGSLDVRWNGDVARALRDAAREIAANASADAMAFDGGARRGAPRWTTPADNDGATIENETETDVSNKPQRGIQSLDITGELLAALVAAGEPLTLRDLAARAGMPPAKAFPHLVSLQKTGLLGRDDAGRFEAGPLGLELGLLGLARLSPVREADAELTSLAAATGMSVALAVPGPLGPTVVRLEEAARPLHVSLRAGTVMSLVNTAIGRVFAAYLDDDVRAALLAQDGLRLAGLAGNDAIPDDYPATLARIRSRGVDTALDKPVPGISTIAAPVFDHTGDVCLVIAVMGTSQSFDSAVDGSPAQMLAAAAQRLSRRFGFI
ncbi:IclR family transcriptional regulator domain-containing protein [Paraburkholderia caballeronis]|uniref:DNA-binding transcriptional regulator, IclR family n=1 Tax=Paraburkholderia caballeronis TaxID=416943 RepID=A0A1H7QP67_9BURK|nr:IclR family transcriptional regulator C-terminal domain-containing protein [Paraburkholderia caballeronis]PXW22440.1 IclR family transcriptional regulator [Paraburkholderia caballeronis]PXW96311.1 IclR family transcriptional regulator [Paraburkholderia caballeronis]RAJ92722.1 IclR family transcriptional regulator [Paraburkholderia caballeronis]SEE01195.1 transcriptional regulator, IclR family [Paraburkholderia caballeronis]SEL49791.1 DNA-binding transcriptional regulator, IclR family [Parab